MTHTRLFGHALCTSIVVHFCNQWKSVSLLNESSPGISVGKASDLIFLKSTGWNSETDHFTENFQTIVITVDFKYLITLCEQYYTGL